MSSNLVIVAIPDENDHVWKVSSEQIPHLTLLFLGEVDQVSNLAAVVEFVEHAASTTLKRFYLSVDRRGELGEDQADVLFFKTKTFDAKTIIEFRSTLLQNSTIRTAYDSATQFEGPWNPHLTLGYPASPAKSDDRDFGIYEVGFNKIAVWIDDFDGPEFLLPDMWEEPAMPMMHAAKVSDTPWSQFKDSDYDDGQYARACLLDRGETAGTAKQRYSLPVREPNGTVNRNACHAAAAVLSSTGGTGSARGSKMKATPEQLAAAKRKLISLYKTTLEEDVPKGLGGEMQQADELGEEFVLEHFGVKGMHWGVRKEQVRSGAARVGSSKVGRGATKVGKGLVRVGKDIYFESPAAQRSARQRVVNNVGEKYSRDISRINKKYEGTKGGKLKTRLTNPLDANVRAYREESRIKYRDRINEEVAKLPTNASGTRRYEIEDGGRTNTQYFWSIKAVDVKKNVRNVKGPVRHADTPDSSLDVDKLFDDVILQPIFDADGYITRVELGEDSMQQTMDLGEAFLAHHGVKGMKWGVRKEEVAGGPAGSHIKISEKTNVATVSTASQVAFGGMALLTGPWAAATFLHPRFRAEWKAAGAHNKLVRQDKKWKKRIDKSKKHVEVHNTAADEINSKLPAFNSDKRWKNLDLTKDPAKQKEYDDAAAKEIINPAYSKAAVKVYGSKSPSGRYTFEVNDASTGTLKFTDTLRKNQAQHAAEDDEDSGTIEVQFKINRDALGHILGFTLADEDAMAQSMDLGSVLIGSLVDDETLEHYGVKGMQWGVRRESAVTTQTHIDTGLRRRRTQVQAKGGESHPAHPDAINAAISKQKLKKSGTAALSNHELNALRNRLQLESQVELLTSKKGKKFVSKTLEEEGKQAFRKGVGVGIRNPKATLKKAKKGAATAATIALLA